MIFLMWMLGERGRGGMGREGRVGGVLFMSLPSVFVRLLALECSPIH